MDRRELSGIIEVYLSIFNDIFSAFMRGGLDFATERVMPYLKQVIKEFPGVFSGFRLELRELNHYILLDNSEKIDPKEVFLGLQMLVRVMYNESREVVENIAPYISNKTRALVMKNYGALRKHNLLEAIPREFREFERGSKKVRLPYGRGHVYITVPRNAEVVRLEDKRPGVDVRASLRESLTSPIGCGRLREMVGEGDRVALIIDDYTRKTPVKDLLGSVLRELEKRTQNITLVVASGLHRRMTQEEVRERTGGLTRYPVVLHDASARDLVGVGKMYTGTELRINRVVAEADFVMSIGSIEPHPYAGFSGGAKSILPGVAGKEAIISSHLLNVYPGCAVSRVRDNPMRQEIENAGRLANLRFIVNTVIGPSGDVAEVVCGDPVKAFQRGAALCEKLFTVEYTEKADIVVATPGGYPKDSTLYLSLRGLRTAELMLKERGIIILVAKCEDHGRLVKKSFSELLKGDPRELISRSLVDKYNLILVTDAEIHEEDFRKLETWASPDDALRGALGRKGIDARIIVMPDLYVIPRMRISEKVQLESILNTMEAGISIVDEDMRIRYMNPYLLGIHGPEAMGKRCHEVFAGRKTPCVSCSMGSSRGICPSETLEITHKDRTFLITHSPMETPDGRVMLLEILTDITLRKELEKKLKEYSRELEKKVRERTKELERANRLKDLFTDIMRHDILNPLGVIKGMAQHLLRLEEFKDSKELQVILKNAERIEELIESSAKYSKLSTLDSLDFQDTDLDETLARVIRNIRPIAEQKNITIDYKSAGKSIARASPFIQDVFANLLSNAIKYSPPSTTITVELRDRGEEWEIAVKDQGVGIPDDYKERVFERFTRMGKKGVKGTGLGLAIVKRTVDLHKGRVWVEDNVVEYTDEKGRPRTRKQGSVFRVVIPKNLGA
jgi:nickel-dependent lactate racemase/signal transduction histidine kinase